jgi:hypothetical protein
MATFKTQLEEVSHWQAFATARGGSRVWTRKANEVAAMLPEVWAAHNEAENKRMEDARPYVMAACAVMAKELERKIRKGA